MEHFAGDFPTWLSPEQIRVLPLSDDHIPYARAVLSQIRQSGIRASLDESSEKLGAKIRRSELEKIPHMFIIGNREQAEQTVTLRSRKNKSLEGSYDLARVIGLIGEEIRERRLS
jgi:threonyl-tRNA synthetase